VEKAFREIRLLHLGFVATWFLLLLVFEFISPVKSSLPAYFPAALGLVCITDITIGFVQRTRYISAATEILRAEPQSQVGLAKWRMANILSFTFAQTVTLFGFLLKFLGWSWNIAGIFFGVGLALLLLWTPRKIQLTP
jgi:hypothetical protein